MFSIITRKKDDKIVGATLLTKSNAFFAAWKKIDELGEQSTYSSVFEHKSGYANEELANEAWEILKKELKNEIV
jgi:hypothetical protein